MISPPTITEDYESALRAYLARQDEAALSGGYEFSRQALTADTGLTEIASAHREVVCGLLAGASTVEECERTARLAMDFFVECMPVFEAVELGFHATIKELRRRTEELDRSNRELQSFAYMASHDLQEPLRVITNYVQLLAERYKGRLDEKADKFINFAVDAAARMQKLIDDLLQYSRVATHGKEFAPTNLEAALAEALANLQVAITESQAEVTHEPLPTVSADALQMTQLLQNLVGNAIRFRSAEPPRIRVSAEVKGEVWEIAVSDNGIGIDPEDQDRIFQIFQRLHTQSEYSGTGIGLAVCQRIVERHGGRIWAESRVGEGSTFRFTVREGGQAEH